MTTSKKHYEVSPVDFDATTKTLTIKKGLLTKDLIDRNNLIKTEIKQINIDVGVKCDSDMSRTFSRLSELLTVKGSEHLDTSNIVNMEMMFYGVSSLKTLDVSNWDTSNVKNMDSAFECASSLKTLDVSNWDTSSAETMHSMFGDASSLKTLDVSNWDTSNVKSAGCMFRGAIRLKNIDVSKWDTNSITDVYSKFVESSSLTELLGMRSGY